MMTDDELTQYKKKNFWKFFLIMCFLAILFLAVGVRLFKIQLIDRAIYEEKAKRQHESAIPLKAKRGDIYDRNGNLLVTSTALYTVGVDIKTLQNKAMVCKILASKTDKDEKFYLDIIDKCEKQVPAKNKPKNRFVYLAKGLQESQIIALKFLKDKGVVILSNPYRNYIYGRNGAQIFGLTDIEGIGLSGLELKYAEELKGENGMMTCQRDGLGKLHLSASLPFIPAKDGLSLQLTIDIDLQKIVEYELQKGVLWSQARSGTVIAIQPQSGEILAMASYPNYDPMNRATATNDRIRNRAITDQYEPGSTFKLITAATAMEEGVITESDSINGFGGRYMLRDRIIRDDHPNGMMTFRQAVQRSSNIAFAQIALRIPSPGGTSLFYKYIRDFGFGLETGVDLLGEASGYLPKAKKFTSIAKAYIGHGYGLSISPIQLAAAYAAAVNDGYLMRPHLVKEVWNSKGTRIKEIHPEMIRQVISPETSRRLRNLFVAAVDSGTGKNAYIEGINIGGKTGTSQQLGEDGIYSQQYYNASFAGFFPAENPQVVLLVVMDRPTISYYGGAIAAPVFKNIAARWIAVRSSYAQSDYEVDSVMRINRKLPEYLRNKSVPNLLGMSTKSAEKQIHNIKLDIEKEQDGIIYKQIPSPGTTMNNVSKIYVKTYANEITYLQTQKKKIKPNVFNLPLRQAMALLNRGGFKTIAHGSGRVYSQSWATDVNNKPVCTLECK
jgi:cell division protein FtsI (penicillin-binding protein 3)